jgi:hypothetical protein
MVRWWKVGIVVAALLAGVLLRAQSNAPARPENAVFSPAHNSFGEAVRHFFGIRTEPIQPIAYQHKPHIEKAKLQCNFCHVGVDKGPMASIPGVKDCMVCHQAIATDKPEIQKVAAYEQRGEEIPWQRVYGWTDEAHVRFNHAPHIRAEVQCATCHGDVPQMTVATRAVDHTMGFCVACHQERKVSNDCLTCHY